MHRRPEDVAAWVNALLVFVVPFGFLFALHAFVHDGAVHPPRTMWVSAALVVYDAMSFVVPFVPLAVLAGWRTRVHAKRRRERKGTGLQGVAEAAAIGFLLAFAVLVPGILTHPTAAPPYVITYGGAGFVIGFVFGLVLATTAIVVVKIEERRRPARL